MRRKSPDIIPGWYNKILENQLPAAFTLSNDCRADFLKFLFHMVQITYVNGTLHVCIWYIVYVCGRLNKCTVDTVCDAMNSI